MNLTPSGKVISTILKHDKKETSYKIALLRAINDTALSFPHLTKLNQDIAIPLRMLAEFWIAYYWSFVDSNNPIRQKFQDKSNEKQRNDMAFRPPLTALRSLWEQEIGTVSRPSDGFFVINELRVPRRRALYSDELLHTYQRTLKAISRTMVEGPIRYAGPGQWNVFAKPQEYSSIRDTVVPVPGTSSTDKCLIISADLWQIFLDLSLWVEALCIHEWCIFTEKSGQRIDNSAEQQRTANPADRGDIYRLLTDRPDNRRPLTWERNHIDLLMMEGAEFVCPWTAKRIYYGIKYDMDHLIPLSVYPINELWNLVPADPNFNSHIKRDQLPSKEKSQQARPHLELAYTHYGSSRQLSQALNDDVAIRFSIIHSHNFPSSIAEAVINLIEQIADSRNIARF